MLDKIIQRRVTHLNTNDISGGAARAAYRLHQGLRGIGLESSMYVRHKSSQDVDAASYDAPPASIIQRLKDRFLRRWLRRRIDQYQETRPHNLEIFSQARTLDGNRVVDALPESDIYNLHWVNGFIDPRPFFQQTHQPVVWTLHDMNPFTGGCHYNVGCRRYRESCGMCPQLGSMEERDLSREIWDYKQDAYQEAIASGRLQIVAPSEWLAREAKSSTLFGSAPVHVIPYGLDHKAFRPRDTEGLRNALSIPTNHRILLFVADSTRNHRKGFDCLQGALSGFDQDNVTLISIGGHEPELKASTPHIHLGRVQSDILLSVFYSLADLFVIPSRQDNLPNTVLESMACGTPVVGFDTGGISDMVRPGETGWLAEVGNTRALRAAITEGLSNDTERHRMSTRCREIVETEYPLKIQAQRYRALYNQMITGTASADAR